MTGRARQVLEALRNFIEEGAGTVCAQVDAVARAAGLSDKTTRKALSELVDEGALEPTGERRDGTTVYRLFDIDTFAPTPSIPVAPALERAEKWMRTAGLHFARPDEVDDELFDETRGMLREFRNDAEVHERMYALWSELRPVGEQVELEVERRAERWREARAHKLAPESPEDAQRAAELANRYGGLNPLPATTTVGVCLDARHGDGADGHRDEQPLFQYGLLLLCHACYRARVRNRDAIARPQEAELEPRFEEWR